eukprot:GFYU01005236.1.p1 GENE.GFYU01005236.1~~GFYU01005236.1.p1  ORF type:complete len:312 (-),score=37.64 GFYU01005236.1:274-1209(-)
MDVADSRSAYQYGSTTIQSSTSQSQSTTGRGNTSASTAATQRPAVVRSVSEASLQSVGSVEGVETANPVAYNASVATVGRGSGDVDLESGQRNQIMQGGHSVSSPTSGGMHGHGSVDLREWTKAWQAFLYNLSMASIGWLYFGFIVVCCCHINSDLTGSSAMAMLRMAAMVSVLGLWAIPRPAFEMAVPRGRRPMTQAERLRLRLALTDRDFSPEDYETLLQLDETVGVSRGALPPQIARLPTHALPEGYEEASATQGRDDDKVRCRICLAKFRGGVMVKTIPCMHQFHSECIDQWLSINSVCPLCNVQVF